MPSVSNPSMRPDGGPRIRLYPDSQPPNEYGEIESHQPFEPLPRPSQAPNRGDLARRVQNILTLPPEEAEIDYEIDMDEGDVCCEDARMQFREALRQRFDKASWNDIDIIVGGSCEELQQELEGWISQEWKENIPQHANREDIQGAKNLHDALVQIQNNWDTCSSQTKTEDMGFYASADAFEVAWDIMQKQIGREDFKYNMQIQPHLMGNQLGNMPAELGLRVGGQIPIKEAISHLQDSEDIEAFARTKGWETAEDVGLHRKDFDDEDEWFEELAANGVGYPAEDFLENEYMYFRPREAQDLALNHRGVLSDAEALRMNLESMGHPNETREAFPPVARDIMLEGLDNRLEAGAKIAPVSTGTISARGQGPMIDVNPAFAGMGLGSSTLAALLENTGSLAEHYLSPGGLATLEGLGQKLDAAGIEHKLRMDPRVRRPRMNEQEQLRNWQNSDARYPHQGNVQMSVPGGTQLTHQGTPDSVGRINHSLAQQIDREPASTDEELRAMFDRAMRHSTQMRREPLSWQNRINWGDDQ